MVDVVMDRLPEFHARRTGRYVEKVHKLVKLNTYILAEQVMFGLDFSFYVGIITFFNLTQHLLFLKFL